MPEDTAWPDDEIVHPRRYRRNVGCSNEDAERIVGFGNPPFPLARLGQMQFATPTRHNYIVVAAAGTLKP